MTAPSDICVSTVAPVAGTGEKVLSPLQASAWRNDGAPRPAIRRANGELVPCRFDNPASPGEAAKWVRVPFVQYVNAPTRSGQNTLGTFFWPYVGGAAPGGGTYAVTPDIVPQVDGWDDGCFLSTSSSDWNSRVEGPLPATGYPGSVYYAKKHDAQTGGYARSTGRSNSAPTLSRFAARDLIVKYNAATHSVSLESSTAGATFTYILYQYTAANQSSSNSRTTYAGPLPLNETTVRFSVNVTVVARTEYSQSFSSWSRSTGNIYLTDPRTDLEVYYDYFAAMKYRLPEIAVKVCTTENDAMVMQAYPSECELFVMDGECTDVEEMVENGRRYESGNAGPFGISTGQVFTAFARHPTIPRWESSLYRVTIPSMHPLKWKHDFSRLYTFSSKPIIGVPVRFDLPEPAAPTSGYFIAPGGSGVGTSASMPGEFYATLRAVGSQTTNVYIAGGNYSITESVPSVNNATVFGSCSPDFVDIDLDRYPTTLVQTKGHVDESVIPANLPAKMAYNLRAESNCDHVALFTSGRYTNCRVGDFTRTVTPRDGSVDIHGKMSIFTAYSAAYDADCECGNVTLTSGAAKDGEPGTETINAVYATRGGNVYLEANVRCAKSVTVRAGDGGQGGDGLDSPPAEPGLYQYRPGSYWTFNSGRDGSSGAKGGSSEARCTAAYCGEVNVIAGNGGHGGKGGHAADCPGGYLSESMIEESGQAICEGGTGGGGGSSGQGGTSTAYCSASDCGTVTVTSGDGGDAPDAGNGGSCTGKRVCDSGWYMGYGGAIFGGSVNYAGHSIVQCSATRCDRVNATAGNGGNMGNGGHGKDAEPVVYDDGYTYERESCGSGGGLAKTYGQPGWSGSSQLTVAVTSCRSVTARTGNGGNAGDGGDTGSGYANYSTNGGKAGDSVNGGKVIAHITVDGSVVFESLGDVSITMGQPGKGGKGGKAHGSPMAVDGEDGGPGIEVVTSANVMRGVLHGQRLGSYSIPAPDNEDSTVHGFPGHPDGAGKGAAWYGGAPGQYADAQCGGNGAPLPGLESPGSGRDGDGAYLGDFWQNGTSP